MRTQIYVSILIIVVIVGGIFFFARGGNEEVSSEGNVVLIEQDGVDEGSVAKNSTIDVITREGQIPVNQIDTQNMIAIIKTNFGEIEIDLLEIDAPNTTVNFVNLALSGFYDGTKFHRIISGFMIQGGDPLTKDDGEQARWGTGGPGYAFPDEIHANNLNTTGTISMANSGPDTNGSQFFINVADNNSLDTKHTVFGKVTKGFEVVQAIEKVQTEGSDRPVEPVVIETIIIK